MKNLLSLTLLAFFLLSNILFLHAEDGDVPKRPPTERQLEIMDAARLDTRLDRMEADVKNLEREVRFMNERIRDLDRSIDDLKRK